MAEIKKLQHNGEDVYLVTHEDAVVDSNGKKLSEKYATKEDLNNIDLSKYATKNDLNNIDLSNYATKEDLNNIDLSDYATKSELQSVFQSGNNVKKQLVDTLIAIGVPNISTSNSWTEINEIVATSISFGPPEPTWSVEAVSGASYGFTYNSSTGYWVSTNAGKANTAAVCKLVIKNEARKTVTMTYINSGESNYDYGIISKVNTTLALTNTADSNNFANFKGSSSTSAKTKELTDAKNYDACWYYIKFRKDGGGNSGNDSFQFKISFS
jgi:hypothetical protein